MPASAAADEGDVVTLVRVGWEDLAVGDAATVDPASSQRNLASSQRDPAGSSTNPASAGRTLPGAAGYVRWPNGFAHLCILTAARARGRGLARMAGSAAVAHALAAGLLPQWRARLKESRAVAGALGFADLGAQVSLRVG